MCALCSAWWVHSIKSCAHARRPFTLHRSRLLWSNNFQFDCSAFCIFALLHFHIFALCIFAPDQTIFNLMVCHFALCILHFHIFVFCIFACSHFCIFTSLFFFIFVPDQTIFNLIVRHFAFSSAFCTLYILLQMLIDGRNIGADLNCWQEPTWSPSIILWKLSKMIKDFCFNETSDYTQCR